MGIDVRDLPVEALANLADNLRERGYGVGLWLPSLGISAEPIFSKLVVRRGQDAQTLTWSPQEIRPGIVRIAIHNHNGWLPWVRRRRAVLQADVTKALEELGGYWPYGD